MQGFSLRSKLTLIITGTTIALGLMVILVIKTILAPNLEKELQEKGIFLANHLASSSVNLMLTEDYLQLKLHLYDFIEHTVSEIRYAYYENDKGEILLHTFSNGFPLDLKGINPLGHYKPHSIIPILTLEEKLFDIVVPIEHDVPGKVHIGISAEHITTSINKILKLLLSIIIGTFSIGALSSFIIAKRITAPLADLVETAEKIGHGELDGRVEIKTQDELGHLGKAFNKMTEALQDTTVSREQYLQQSEFLKQILEAIPYPFYVVDINDYSIRMANLALADKKIWETSTCYALTHKKNMPCSNDNSIDCPLEEVKKTGEPAIVEHIHTNEKGEKTTYEVHGFPIFNTQGKLIQMIEYSIDVTKKKETLESLHQSRKELEKTNQIIETNRNNLLNALKEISNLINQVIYQKNMDVSYANPQLLKCYEVMDCEKEDCHCYGSEESLRCWQVTGTYCGKSIQGDLTNRYDNCNKCKVYKHATSDPIYQVGEHFNNMMHILKLKNKDLEEAYDNLKNTQSQMLQREKMASIGQLAAGVAHEINNPMGFIFSNLSSLKKYADKLSTFIEDQTTVVKILDDSQVEVQELKQKRKKLKVDFIAEDIKDLVEESLEGAERVKKIVMNLKNFSRIEQSTEYKLANINDCIESTLSIAWNEIKYKATLTKEYGDFPPTKCYPMELNQVFMNILVNAAQAIEKQGEIVIKTWQNNDSIFITISDTGSGIPEDKLGKIFEPFFTTKEVGMGTGLGMSIAYEIIKKHEGEITVESSIGIGTTFTIQLPLLQEAA